MGLEPTTLCFLDMLSRQSALPTELPGQLSRQGSKSTIQHNTRQSQTPIHIIGALYIILCVCSGKV